MKKSFFILLIVITYLIVSCQSFLTNPQSPIKTPPVSPLAMPSPRPTPTKPKPTLEPISLKPDKAAIVGKIEVKNVLEGTSPDLNIFLAPFTWNESKTDGVFLYNTQTDISVKLISGQFQFANITPGSYVLLVGNEIQNSAAIKIEKEKEKAEVFEVKAGQILDIGKRKVLTLAP